MLCLNKGNIALSPGNIWCTSCRNEIKKVFWIFIFENFIKEKVSCTNDEDEGTLGLILGRFFILTYLE